jgi:AraC-like DNA-binding protein
VLIKDILPHTSLSEFIRKYQVIRWKYDASKVPPTKYLAPRPEHSLTFYIRDLQSYSFIGSKKKDTYPKSIISGIHTTTLIRDCGHDFWAIKIIFQPCALYRLTGIPMRELVSNYVDAEAIFGKEVNYVYERLSGSDNLQEMVEIIEQYLKKVISLKTKYFHPIDFVCHQLLVQDQLQNIDVLAKKSYLSTRQFIRKFEERTGVSPKLFDRIIRFDKAYRYKNNHPNLDWLTISLENGYYDYQHLSKDYKDFTGYTPAMYYDIDLKAPERDFGLHFG